MQGSIDRPKILSIYTGKSLSEALFFFAEHGENILCTKIVLNVSNNFCTQHVLSSEFSCTDLLIQWTICWHIVGLLIKNKSFWQRFTCIELHKIDHKTGKPNKIQLFYTLVRDFSDVRTQELVLDQAWYVLITCFHESWIFYL